MNVTKKVNLKSIVMEYFTPHTGYAKILVNEGQKIKKEETLAKIERLGVITEYKAKDDGLVLKLNDFLKNEGFLEYNIPLMQIKYPITDEEIKRRDNKDIETIKAQMEATYHLTSSESETPLVKEGERIEKGQLIAVFMVTKEKWEFHSPLEGKIVYINFKSGDTLKKDDVLFGIAK